MKMGGAHIVAPLRAQKVPDRPVDRNRIAGRLDRAETEMAMRVGDELAAQVHVRLDWVLVFIEAFRRGMPDIDLDALYRLPVDVAVEGVDEQRGPGRRRTHNRRTAFHQRRIHPPERPELAGVGLGLTVVAVVE